MPSGTVGEDAPMSDRVLALSAAETDALPRAELREAIQTLVAPGEPGIDKLIHERTRLAIMSSLAAVESLSFADLKTLLQASDGNLSVHARKLEHAGYVDATKYFDGRTPKTRFRLTNSGREALASYLDHMERIIVAARADAAHATDRPAMAGRDA